jgi:hypothetical protein
LIDVNVLLTPLRLLTSRAPDVPEGGKPSTEAGFVKVEKGVRAEGAEAPIRQVLPSNDVQLVPRKIAVATPAIAVAELR